jgi:peptide-methionine (S)-S-oxide reductase
MLQLDVRVFIYFCLLLPVYGFDSMQIRKVESMNSLKTNINTEFTLLGGGCFWCMEAVFQRLEGVTSVKSGFSGGHVKNPSYRQVCDEDTGHAEVICVEFDPDKISFEDILSVYWQAHNPTTLNRQGNDVGPQYRSVIFYTSEQQRKEALASIQEAQKHFDEPIVTQVEPFESFYPAEDYHEDYYARNKTQPYCNLVISPKLKKLEEKKIIPTVDKEAKK